LFAKFENSSGVVFRDAKISRRLLTFKFGKETLITPLEEKNRVNFDS